MNLTQLEAGKRGPALLNRLVGDASIYKKLLDRKPLPSEDGVKYFMETVRPHDTRWGQSVFLRLCFYLFRARRENMEIVKWIEQISLLLKRLKDSWIDMLPTTDRYLLHRRETPKTKSVTCWYGPRRWRKTKQKSGTSVSGFTGNKRKVECHTGGRPRKAFSIQW